MLPPAAGADEDGATAGADEDGATAGADEDGATAGADEGAADDEGAVVDFFLLLHASRSAPGTTARPAAPARPLSTERRLSGVSTPGVPDPESDMVPPSVW